MERKATVTITVEYDDEWADHPSRWDWSELIGNTAAVEPVANGREWPDNNASRISEDVALLNEIADLMLERHTPHAINCKDKGCGPDLLSEYDWTRQYALEDHVWWLRNEAIKTLNERRARGGQS